MFELQWAGTGVRPYTMSLARFSDNVTHARPAFEAMADHQAEVNRRQFEGEGGTMSGPWAPLSPRYAAWKSRRYPGQPIMVLTGALRRELTDRPFGVEEIGDRRMTIGTDLPYAAAHQFGVPGMLPQRQLLGRPPMVDKKVFAKILHSWVVTRRAGV